MRTGGGEHGTFGECYGGGGWQQGSVTGRVTSPGPKPVPLAWYESLALGPNPSLLPGREM